MHIVSADISNIIVCKKSSSSTIVFEGVLWSPIPFTVNFEGEGLKCLPHWNIALETQNGVQFIPQDSIRTIEGV